MSYTLAGFAALLVEAAVHVREKNHAALEEGATIIEAESKRVIGTYDYGWPALGPAAVAKHGDTPLLDTGGMRDSIQHNADHTEAYVGSDDPKAKWQELGTSRGIPPRSFLGLAAVHKEKEVVEKIGRRIAHNLIS